MNYLTSQSKEFTKELIDDGFAIQTETKFGVKIISARKVIESSGKPSFERIYNYVEAPELTGDFHRDQIIIQNINHAKKLKNTI